MSNYIEVKVKDYKMRVRPNEGGIHGGLRRLAKSGGEREPELLHVLRKEITPGMNCIDLGANIGYATLLMSEKAGHHGKVYAIEPDPANIELLRMNLSINNRSGPVKIFEMGISNRPGEMNFYTGIASNLGGMAKTNRTVGKPIKVNVDTLTNFCKNEDLSPELIKMDIEGHEVEVLAGMYELVNQEEFPCKIVMELHPVRYSKEHSLERWVSRYLESGFKTKYVISAGVVQPDLFREWGYKPIETFTSIRGLYDNFSDDHMIKACCHLNKQYMPQKGRFSPKIARFLMIERSYDYE